MDSRKPEPLFTTPSLGSICPICGKKSYSVGGIHPQCAMQQADAPRQALLAALKREKKCAADADKHPNVAKKQTSTYKYGRSKTHG